MTFQQLQYLLEVYRAGSVSQAAKNLYLAQSSVSAAISNLENELGFFIFNRTKYGMIPTVPGLEVIERAEHICENYRLMTQAGEQKQRHIRISAPSYQPCRNAFTRLVAENADNDSVTFSQERCKSSTYMTKLALFELDLSVRLVHEPRILAIESALAAKGLHCKRWNSVPVMLKIGPGHRLYNVQDISAHDLENDLLVDAPQGTIVHNAFLRGVMRLSPSRTVFVSSTSIRNQLISQGLAYSIGVEASEKAKEMYGFRSIPLDDLSYRLITITNPARPLAPEVERYLELLEEELCDK